MQKQKIIAMIVAGLSSGAVFAQSNVTMYGVMDAGVYSWSASSKGAASKARTTGVSSSGVSTSRLGFKGEENLGDGLKATFMLESRVSLDSQDALASNRQSHVGLKGSFGEVAVGVQSTISDSWNWRSGLENMGNQSAHYLLQTNSFASQKTPGITYYTPEFSGLTFGAGVVFIDEGGDKRTTTGGYKIGKSTDERSTVYQIGARYVNGPLVLAATAAVNTHDLLDSRKQYTLGGVYNFGFMRVQSMFERIKTGSEYRTAYEAGTPPKHATWGEDVTRDLLSVGLSVPVTEKNVVHMGYAMTSNDSYMKAGVKQKDLDAKGYMLGYQYLMSKRTQVYAAYSRIDNEKNATYMAPPAYNRSPNEAFTNVAGRDYNGFTVGIRHAY